MAPSISNFRIDNDRVFTDYRQCIEQTKPNLILLCPATARHGQWVEQIAPFGTHILMEKPFAASLQEADSMIAAMNPTGKTLAINLAVGNGWHHTGRRIGWSMKLRSATSWKFIFMTATGGHSGIRPTRSLPMKMK